MTLSPDDLKRLAEIVGWQAYRATEYWNHERLMARAYDDEEPEITPYGMESIKEYLRGKSAFEKGSFFRCLYKVVRARLGKPSFIVAVDATPDDYGHAVVEME